MLSRFLCLCLLVIDGLVSGIRIHQVLFGMDRWLSQDSLWEERYESHLLMLVGMFSVVIDRWLLSW